MKSTLLKFFLTLTSVLLFGVNASAQGTTVLDEDGFPTNASSASIKFFFSVTGFSQLEGKGTASTVYATVFDGAEQDYNFEVVLPNKNNIVCSDQATVRAMMRNVASLDVDANETRTHKVTINTQTSVSSQTLGAWLPKTYGFQGATLPITVVDYNHGETIKKEFTYTLSGAAHGVDGWRITGVRNNFQDAHDAWYLITKGPNEDHVTADRKGDEDSFLYLPAGAYVQMYNGRVTASSAVSMSEGNFDLAALRQMFSTVETVANPEEKAVFYLPQGTKLTIGASYATLNEPAWITVDLTKMPQSKTLKDVLSNLKTASKDNSSFIQAFLQMFDGLVEAVDLAEEVPIEVRFGQPGAYIQVYPGSLEPLPELKTHEEFKQILEDHPNAVGMVRNQYATSDHIAECQAEGVKNIVIEYKAGSYNNYYYESPNFVFTDRKSGANCNYYSPVDFIAVKGGYTRNFSSKNSTICVPFALTNNNFSKNMTFMTFAYYEPIEGYDNAWAYFNSRESIDAGVPCFMYNYSGANNLTVTFENEKIVRMPINSFNIHGAFMTISDYDRSGYYGVSANDKWLAAYTTENRSIFRAALYMGYDIEFNNGANNTGSNSVKTLQIAIINSKGEATAIDGTIIKQDLSRQEIYNLNGQKVNNIAKPGLYIVNGVKYFKK